MSVQIGPVRGAPSSGAARSIVGRCAPAAIGAAAIALLAAGNNLANAAENPARTAQEQHACAVVRGLDPLSRRYDACIRSLDRSLSEWDYTRFVSTGRGTCAQEGLAPGTPSFAVCVVNAEQSR
jgi:hypothetical protein